MKTTLLLGYGNYDRQDDGVAWHILAQTCARLGLAVPSTPDEEFSPQGGEIDFLFTLQLTPELAETAAAYARICFIDAHTGRVPEDIHFSSIEPHFQSSPFTHHMTAETLLELTDHLYAGHPQAMLLSVRGYEFGFSQHLSIPTAHLADQAVEQLLTWLLNSRAEMPD